MSSASLASGIVALLTTEPQFVADIALLFGAPITRVIKSNRPVSQIPGDMLPCFVVEHADGEASALLNSGEDADGLVIGNSRQGFASELDFAVVWSQDDRDQAFDRKAALPDVCARLFMRNPNVAGTGLTYLARWVQDQSIAHPRHFFAATARAEYPIYRS